MKKFLKIFVLGVFSLASLGFSSQAMAYYPTLTATLQGNNNNVQISVSGGSPYAQVSLFSRQSSTLWTSVNNIGQTDGSGYFTQVISMPSDGSSSQIQMYATVGSDQTSTINVYPGGNNNCGSYGCNIGGLTVYPSSLNLNVGQSATANVSIGSYIYSGSYYISSNSNSNVASASISGSTVNVYANQTGSTAISICQSGASGCVSLYVTVSGSGSGYGNIYFSPSTLSLTSGQNSNVSISSNSGYYGSYYISSNSNSNVASAYISGSSLYVNALTSGSTNIYVCQNSSSNCATLYVTVSGGSSGSGNIWFGPSSPSLNVGQALAVSINSTAYTSGSSYNSTYYISNNSNSSVVSATISGTVMNLYGNSAGSSSITVCSSYLGYCGTVYVTVSGNNCGSYNCGSGNLSLSQTSVNLSVSQTVTVTANNVPAIYVSSNSNPSVVNSVLDVNRVNLYGLGVGSSTVYVCAIGSSSQCASIYVTVSGSGSGYGNIYFSPSTLSLTSGQNSNVSISSNSGYYGSYYISSNSNSNVASAYISGSSLYVNALTSGSTNIYVCQNSSSNCATLYVTVSGGSCGYYGCGTGTGSLYFNTASLPIMVIGQYYSYQLQVTGGSYPYNYYVTSGSLPYGLSLSSSGLISGVPNSTNTATFTVRVNDNLGRSATANFTIGNTGGGLSYPGGVLGASAYASGRLIKENGTVYIVYKNTKTGFVSASVFTGLGFKFGNVTDVGSSGLADSGYTVRTAVASHPWGAWIKNGSTVYFVHESGLIPVADYATFINNGGQDSYVVNANTYDFRLPMLSVMTYSDSRLQ